MNHHARALVLAIAISAVAVPAATGQGTPGTADSMHAVAANAIAWADLEAPGFDPGVKMAVIHGNPGEAGAYTLRLSFPAGYRFPAHWHPMPENVTVLSGEMRLGMGGQVDDTKLKSYRPGDYLYIPATMPHFGGVRGATVVQLHGTGPFTINLVTTVAR